MPKSDNTLRKSNVPSGARERKGDWPVLSARVTADELSLIDAAAYRAGVKRGHLCRDATLAQARLILQGSKAA